MAGITGSTSAGKPVSFENIESSNIMDAWAFNRSLK
jgi:hypothetical protein